MNAERLELGELKPDICAYKMGTVSSGITDFSSIEVHIEVKLSVGDDPFNDDEQKPFEPITNTSRDTRNQIISYAVAQLALQFRTHIFSVIIIKDRARLIRWDRAGAVVTAAFPYCHVHSELVDFFRRYGLLDTKLRGVDESVQQPSELEATQARDILNLPPHNPLVKLAVHDAADQGIKYYIGPKPEMLRHASPTGRCTRTFIAHDVQTGRKVFVKDTWRIDLPVMEKEGEVYEALKQANVSHIAPFILGADVSDHHTRTQAYVGKEWAHRDPKAKDLRPHQQYRLVLGVVARSLTSFNSSLELVNAIADALQGRYMFTS